MNHRAALLNGRPQEQEWDQGMLQESPKAMQPPRLKGAHPPKPPGLGNGIFFPLVHPNPIAQSQLLCEGETVSARDKDSS